MTAIGRHSNSLTKVESKAKCVRKTIANNMIIIRNLMMHLTT